MAQNEKIRTEDVIDILDAKILTLTAHPALGVVARENYDSVLNKVAARVLTADEKLAFDNTLTYPSSINPVVLKDDLPTYVRNADLGNIKDSVLTYANLPAAPLNDLGDLRAVVADNIIYRWNGSSFTFVPADVDTGTDTITHSLHGLADNTALTLESTGRLPTGFLPHIFYYVVSATLNTFKLALSVGGSPVNIMDQGTGIHQVVYSAAWSQFIHTGTLDHTQLINQDGSASYQHLTTTQKSDLLLNKHTHTNKAVLDAILSAGSGQIITAAERSRIPTPDQKSALAGTAGSPSAINQYVTNSDPRLNTVRNPYVTIGPPGSLASFQGVDFRPFEDALLAIDIGTATSVKAIEVLPGFYSLGGVYLQWTTQASSIIIEASTPGSVTLSFQSFVAGIQALDTPFTGKGQIVLRGFTFELNDNGTSGILSQRRSTLIENCTFKPGPTIAPNQVGLTLEGDECIVRKCRFEGQLTKGIELKGKYCRVENCTFILSSATAKAIEVYGDYNTIDHCNFTMGTLQIDPSADYTGIYNNTFSVGYGLLVDNGNSSRWLENQPEEVNQPYYGCTRTVGLPGTYADYRGTDQTPFVAALADPNTTEVLVMRGTYAINATVAVPSGKLLRGINPNSPPYLMSTVSNLSIITLNSFAGVSTLKFAGINAPLITTMPNAQGSSISNCILNPESTAVAISSPSGSSDFSIIGSTFSNGRGIFAQSSTRLKVLSNVFTAATLAPVTTSSSCEWAFVKNNQFIAGIAPDIHGSNLLIEENFFDIVPTKIDTINSIWQGNWPHPEANNDEGVDTLNISLERYMEAVTDGCARSTLYGIGTVSFPEGTISAAGTGSVPISKLNRTLGYSVDLYWAAAIGNLGNAVWRATVVFRDSVNGMIGTLVQKSVISARTNTTLFTFAPVDVDAGLNTITINGHGLIDGSIISFSSTGALPGGLYAGIPYYVINSTLNTFKLSLAYGGSAVALLTQGSGVHSLLNPRTENLTSINFSNLEYGLGGGINPSHVSLIVERLGDSISDTMTVPVHLVEAQINLPRD